MAGVGRRVHEPHSCGGRSPLCHRIQARGHKRAAGFGDSRTCQGTRRGSCGHGLARALGTSDLCHESGDSDVRLSGAAAVFGRRLRPLEFDMSTDSTGPQAIIFDLDGVITFTARLHAAAWKELFDQYLRSRTSRFGEPFREFTIAGDYLTYVDGKPRYDGVASFLASRSIAIPYGSPSDPEDAETICGLGNRKDHLFMKKVRELGVDVDEDAVRFARELRNHGVRIGLASSSRNTRPILQQAGLEHLFDAIVDGLVSD